MRLRDTRVVHALIGNDTPEVQTGLTRGIVATGLASILKSLALIGAARPLAARLALRQSPQRERQ